MNETNAEPQLIDVELGSSCTALLGADNGKYPDANGLLIRGSDRTALIEPTLGVAARRGRLPAVDLVLLSHCHEDHIPALPHYPEAECWVHEADRYGLESVDRFMDLFGLEEPRRSELARICVEKFNYRPRPDALSFADRHVWDLGGVTIKAIHSPGHTAGHCFFLVEPDQVLFLGDVDLSSFGPYYADADSSLEDFERSIEVARKIEARYYVSAHHKGIVDPGTFSELIEKYGKVISTRDERLLAFLDQPRSLDDIVAHRFIYRPKDNVAGIDGVERVSMGLHLERLERRGRIRRREEGYYAVQR